MIEIKENHGIIKINTICGKYMFFQYEKKKTTMNDIYNVIFNKVKYSYTNMKSPENFGLLIGKKYWPYEFDITDEENEIDFLDKLDMYKFIADTEKSNNKLPFNIFIVEKEKIPPNCFDNNIKNSTKTMLVKDHRYDFSEDFVDFEGFLSDEIFITIHTLTGKNIRLRPRIRDNIYDIKSMIQDKEGIPPAQQRLVYSGRQLEDKFSLSDYDICDDAHIHLILRMRGGMYTELSGKDGNYLPILKNIYCDMTSDVIFDL